METTTEDPKNVIVNSGGAVRLKNMGIDVEGLIKAGMEVNGRVVECTVKYIDPEQLLQFITTTYVEFHDTDGITIERDTKVFCGFIKRRGVFGGVLDVFHQKETSEIVWERDHSSRFSIILNMRNSLQDPEKLNDTRYPDDRFFPDSLKDQYKNNDTILFGGLCIYPHRRFQEAEGFWIVPDKEEGDFRLGYPDTREPMIDKPEIFQVKMPDDKAIKEVSVIGNLARVIRPVLLNPDRDYYNSGTLFIGENFHWLVSRRIDFEGTVVAWFNAIKAELQGNSVPRGFSFDQMVVYQGESLKPSIDEKVF